MGRDRVWLSFKSLDRGRRMRDADALEAKADPKNGDRSAVPEEKSRFVSDRLRLRFRNIGAVVASVAGVGAAASGLLGYWNVSTRPISYHDRALAKRPASALAHMVKGETLRNVRGHPEEAITEYDAALEIDPNYPPAYLSKGIALIQSGRARVLYGHRTAKRPLANHGRSN
jgi:tetratricopeptide (TPR) repeat protein